jgi:hypothetical protein
MKKPKFKNEVYAKLKDYIEKTKGNEFSFGDMKKSIFGYTWYGGGKFKRKLIEVFNLEEIKDGKTLLLRVKK